MVEEGIERTVSLTQGVHVSLFYEKLCHEEQQFFRKVMKRHFHSFYCGLEELNDTRECNPDSDNRDYQEIKEISPRRLLVLGAPWQIGLVPSDNEWD